MRKTGQRKLLGFFKIDDIIISLILDYTRDYDKILNEKTARC